MDCSSPPTEEIAPVEVYVCVSLIRSIPEERSRYEGTNLPPPGAPQLEAIHLEVSSFPFEKSSKNVAPVGATTRLSGPLALSPASWGGAKAMLPPPQPARKRVAKTKTLIFFIEILSCTGDRDRRTNPFWPEGRRDLRNLSISDCWSS